MSSLSPLSSRRSSSSSSAFDQESVDMEWSASASSASFGAVFGSQKVDPTSRTPYSDATQCRKQKKHVCRPMNPFMVWSHIERRQLVDKIPDWHNADISKYLGKMWKQMSVEQKRPYVAESEALRQLHNLEYPNYKYQPRKKIYKQSAQTVTSSSSSSSSLSSSAAASKSSDDDRDWTASTKRSKGGRSKGGSSGRGRPASTRVAASKSKRVSTTELSAGGVSKRRPQVDRTLTARTLPPGTSLLRIQTSCLVSENSNSSASPATPESGFSSYSSSAFSDCLSSTYSSSDRCGSSLADLDELPEVDLIPGDWNLPLDNSLDLAKIIEAVDWSDSTTAPTSLTVDVTVGGQTLLTPDSDPSASWSSPQDSLDEVRPADDGEYCTPEVSALIGNDVWIDSAFGLGSVLRC